jgi:hypothetical protein
VHYWQRLLDNGTYRSITEIATAEGMDLGQASRIFRLTQLAPDIIEACLACRLGWAATSIVSTHGLTARDPDRVKTPFAV